MVGDGQIVADLMPLEVCFCIWSTGRASGELNVDGRSGLRAAIHRATLCASSGNPERKADLAPLGSS